MEVMKLLEYLQEIIDTAHSVPIVGKIMIDKQEAVDILEQVINYLPDEFKKAQWICEEKERIISDAQKEAELIKRESYEMLKKEIENHDITKEAKIRAEKLINSAQRDSKVIRLGAKDYADEILCSLEKEVTDSGQKMLNHIKNEMQQFLTQFDKEIKNTSSEIRNNVKELRETVK